MTRGSQRNLTISRQWAKNLTVSRQKGHIFIVNRHKSSLILTVRRFADVPHLTIFPITAAQREQLKILKDLQTGKP